MTIKNLNSTLKTSLENYDPFIVAHLVKFERPTISSAQGGVANISATSYSYFTDAQHDILFDDGEVDTAGNPLNAQTYRANKLQKLGTVNENIQAKASNMSLVIDSSSLGTSVDSILTFTTSEITAEIDLSSEGFQEGDKVLLLKTAGTTGNHDKHVRIESFKNGGKTIVYTPIDTIQTTSVGSEYTISQASEEIVSILSDKYSESYTGYINREVLVYRAHIHPETRAIIGEPYLYFKGITSGVSLDEKLDASKITWTLSSHWGDFLRVQGRLTDDSTHRSLKLDGTPDLDSVIRPEYAGDLGFMHANTAVNQIASYMVEEEYLAVQPTSGHLNFQSTETVTKTRNVEKNINLSFNPEAKMLPVVYGVRKLDSFPVFVDTHKDTSAEVYKLDAICEGKISGILDIHIDDIPTLCLDASDFNTRNPNGTDYEEDEVEIECVGRADRGDTLAQYNASPADTQPPGQWGYGCTGYSEDLMGPSLSQAAGIPNGGDYFLGVTYEDLATGANNGQTQDATGLLHEGTHTILKPTPVNLTFHQGLENQRANDTLVSTAAALNFKVQNDYYDPTRGAYWSPSHRLLDTAYVVGKYQLGEGATTIPKLQYVVRGRDPECYNYDGSYKESSYYNSASHSSFPLGSSVTLHETINDDQIGDAVDIIDKWASFDSDGIRDYRFRFSTIPTLIDASGDPITSFYMKNSDNDKWYMETWDIVRETGSVHSTLRSSTFTVSDTASQYGLKATFSSIDANFESALEDSAALIGVDTSSTATSLLASSWVYASYSDDVLDNLTNFETDPGITHIYVKNAIKLDRSLGAVWDDAFVGAKITVKSGGDNPYVQTRIIKKYDGATGIAFVDSPWDWNHIPTGADSYTIGSLGDKRVTLNPAMQLLDYMTSKRYGKGLDVEKDINIEDFKKAARECDTRSDVTMIFPSGSTFTKGEKWQYPSSTAPLQWRGTVKEDPKTVNGKVEVTFTDVIGKIASKWNNYRTYPLTHPYWYDGNLYMGTGSSVPSAPTGAGALTVFSISKTGDDNTSRNVDLSSSAANGNPVVKKHSSITGAFTASGYSLYDCDDVKYWKYVGWDDTSQRNVTRHQMNQVIDTTLPIFENINNMLTQFNGMLNYSAGKYSLHIKSKKGFVDNVEKISNEDIIGTIKLTDNGVKSSKNYVTTSILDPQSKFSSRSVSFFNSKYLKEDNGVQKKATFSLPGITNYYNARFNIKQRLDESRFGLTIQFTMAPKGLLLNAGSIIEITYPRFGYSSKEFRITNLNLKKDGTVDVTASEHNDKAYEVSQEGSGASTGFGILEEPESSQAPLPLPIISPPTSLACTQNKQGEILLSWSNSSTFSSATHITEIYSSTVNDFQNTTDPVSLIGTSSTNTFSDLVTEGQGNKTRYYWIRYQVKTNKLNLKGTDFRNVPSRIEPAAPETGTHVGVEGVGQAAFAVRTIKLSPGETSAFVYNNAGDGIQFGNATSTTMSTTRANVAGTESFKWYKDGVELQNETDSSFDYTAPTNVSDMPQIIKVELTDTLADGTTFTAEDEFTFIGLRTVEDAYTVIPSTPNYNFQATEFGTIDGPASFSTTFSVRKGGTAYTYDGTSTYDANSYRYGTITNITPLGAVVISESDNIDPTTGAISISTSAGNFLTGTSVTQCSFDVPIIDNADGETIATSRIVLSKSLDGINARTVKLTAPEQVIAYDSTGSTPNPSAQFQITAEPFNTTGVPKYEFFVNGSPAQASSTTATFDYTPPAAYSSLPQIITVKLREGSSQNVLATDSFTVFGVKDATDAVDQKTVFIFRLNDGDGEVGFSTESPYSEASPATAANQTFSDPLEGLENGWSTSQPAIENNNDVIYMSQRTFTSDGSSPQQSAWEEPVVAAKRIDGTSFAVVGSVPNAATANVRFRFEEAAYPDTGFTYTTPNILVASPTEQSYSVIIPNEEVGSNTFTSLLMYVSPRDVPVHLGGFVLNASSDTADTLEPNFSEGFGGATITEVANSSLGEYEHPSGGTTEDWGGFANTESTLIDDAISFSSDGSISFNASIPNYTTQAQTILNAAFNTSGDPASIGDAVYAQDTGNLWVWDGTSWDDVGQIKGDPGANGINEKRVYLFNKNPTLTDGNPPAVTLDAGQQTYLNTTDGVINGWTTTQGSLTDDGDIIYMVERLFTSSGTGTETSWSTPIIIAQRIDGVSPDALTITSTSKTGSVTTITFSDDTIVEVSDGTNGTDAGVKVIYADDANGTNASFTQVKDFVNYYEWTGDAPTEVPTGLTYTKFVGEDGDNEGVLPIYAEDASGTNASFEMGSKEFVNFYEWTSSAPISVPAGLTYVKFVGEDGAPGPDPVLLAYDNDGHVVPVSTSGAAVFTNSGGVLRVYEGTTELSLYQNSQTTDFPPVANPSTFSLDISKVAGDTLIEPAISGSGSAGATIADFNVGADPSTLTQVTKYKITAYIRAAEGSTYTRSVDVSLVPGNQGETGPDGLRTVTGYLYYEDTTGSVPNAPSGNTYHFTGDNIGLVTGTGINNTGTTNCWKNTPNTMQSTSTNAYYTVPYHGIEAASGSSSATVTYGTVRVHTSFSGVVTFSSGAFSQDGTEISDIDGTKVKLNDTPLSETNTLNVNTTANDVGLDALTNHLQVRNDLVDAPTGILNNQILINSDGTLENAGSGQVTAEGINAVPLSLLSGTTSDSGDTVTLSGNKITVTGPDKKSWNTHVYSKDAYPTASVSFVASQNDAFIFVGLNENPADSTSYESINYSWYLRGTHSPSTTLDNQANPSMNMANKGTPVNYSAGDLFSITYDGINVRWFHNGVLKHTEAASTTYNLHMDSSFYGYQPLNNSNDVSSSIEKLTFGPLTSGKDVLESDHTGPINGVSASEVTEGAAGGANVFAQHSLLPGADEALWGIPNADNGIWQTLGLASDNSIILEPGPLGDPAKIWKAATANGVMGGFGNGDTDRFSIDAGAPYRFTVFAKQSQEDGQLYFGIKNYNLGGTEIDIYEVSDAGSNNGSTSRTWYTGDLPSYDEWYLFVGIVNSFSISTDSQLSGLYKVSTGERVESFVDFRFNMSATEFMVSSYLFDLTPFSTDALYSYWASPRVDRLDRPHPTIMQLLGSQASVLNREISLNADGTLNNAGGGAVTAEGLGAESLELLSTNSTKPVTITGNKISADYETIGSNLISNGDFTNDAGGWSLGSDFVWDRAGTVKRVSGSSNSYFSQNIDIVSGKYYRLRYDVIHTGGGNHTNQFSDWSGTGSANHGSSLYGSGSQDLIIQAGHTDTIEFKLYGIGDFRGYFDNVRIEEVADITDAWDTHVFSKDGYPAASTTFVCDQSDSYIAAGLNTDPNTNTSYDSIDYAWDLKPSGGLGIRENGTEVALGGATYLVGDKFTVTYDGINVKYFRNGSLVRTVEAALQSNLYFDSSFARPNQSLSKVGFGPITDVQSIPKANVGLDQVTNHTQVRHDLVDAPNAIKNDQIVLNADGTMTGAAAGSAVTAAGLGAESLDLLSGGSKPITLRANKIVVGDDGTGSEAWNTHVYSKDGYPAAHVSFVADQNDAYLMVGLNTDPTENTSYDSIDYSWFLRETGGTRFYSGDNNLGDGDAYSIGDKFAITYDGTKVQWFHNGNLKKTVDVTISGNLHLDSSYKRNNKSISKVSFGAVTDVSTLKGDLEGSVNGVAANAVSDGALDGAQVQSQQSLLPGGDDSEWELGEAGDSKNGKWHKYGTGSENQVVYEAGPFGDTVKVWKSVTNDEGATDGGISARSHKFPYTSDAIYRFTVFQKASAKSGTMYWQCTAYTSAGTGEYDGENVSEFDGTSNSTNKAWHSGDMPENDRWYLFVGYLNPNGTSVNSGKGGLYDVVTGERVVADDDLRVNASGVTHWAPRAVHYDEPAGGDDVTIRWALPRVERMDRPHPSIMQLLANDSSVLNNQISINADGTLNNAGSGGVTAEGIGAETLELLSTTGTGDSVEIKGNSITVTGPDRKSWDTGVYSKNGYPTASVSFSPAQDDAFIMVGLNDDPDNQANHDDMVYYWYLRGDYSGGDSSDHKATARINDQDLGNAFVYSPGDVFTVTYDGVTAKWFHNGVLKKSQAASSTDSLYFDSSWYGYQPYNSSNSQSSTIKKVSFTEIPSLAVIPKSSVGLDNLNNPPSLITPISTADVSPNIGGVGQSQIDGSVIKAGSAVIAGQGTNKAGITGTAADGSIGTDANSAETDIRIFSGSTFANRASAPFRVQQNGAFRAEFGHIGGFTVGGDSLVSETASQPLLTIGSNLAANPAQQISLSSRAADEFLLYAGIEVPAGGVGLKKSDNPPFGVDSDGKVFMREFELKDANNNVILDSDNLLGPAINAQITDLLKAGADSVTYTDRNPNTGFKLILTKTQNIQIDWRVNPGFFRVYGLDKDDGSGNGYTEDNALKSICPQIKIKLERSTTGSTWTTVQTKTYAGIRQAGSQPSLGSNEYWIDAESYQSRSHGAAWRSEIRRGYGAVDEAGYFNETYTVNNQAAGTYYYRINMNTSGTKGIQLYSRAYEPADAAWYVEDEVLDAGYGSIGATVTNFGGINNPRNFTVTTYSAAGTTAGGSYSIDLNASPPTVKEGKTFEDFLALTGGAVYGTIGLYGGGYLRTPRIDGFGGSLILEAGESATHSTAQSSERVYINAENGLEINSHRNDWNYHAGTNTPAGWEGRKTCYINNSVGNSSFPGRIGVSGDVQIYGGDNMVRLSKGGIRGVDGHTVSSVSSAPFFYVRTVKARNLTTPTQVQNGDLVHNTHHYSSGSIWHGANTFWRSADATVMYTMYVKNHGTSTSTKKLSLHRVDDNIYAYVNGTLTDSQAWMSGRSENVVDLDIVIPGKDNSTDAWKVSRVDIIVNDAGGGTDALEMYGSIIDYNNHPIEYQPFTAGTYAPDDTDFDGENVSNS